MVRSFPITQMGVGLFSLPAAAVCSTEGAVLAERSRQHREMRLKGNAELKDKVEELKVKLQTERAHMQKDFEGQVSFTMQHATANTTLG